jgi:hypothetical protein
MASLYYLPQYAQTTLNKVGGLDGSETSGIKLTALPSDIDSDVPGIVCLTYANPIDTSKAEWITYTSIDGTYVLQGVTRGQEGYAAKTHENGCTIAWVVSKSHFKNINDKLRGVDTVLALDVHGNEVIKTSHTDSAVNEITIVNAATTAFPTIQATGEADTGIDFENSEGEEILKLDAIASAVNEITIKNAIASASPVLQMSGTDSNIGLDIKTKGTAYMRKPTVVGIQVLDATSATSTGDGKAFFRCPAELNGMNLTGIAASVYTAGVTGNLDIMIRNKTDTHDMLSTKMRIETTETDTSTSAQPGTIDTSEDDVVTGDIIAVDIDAVQSGTAALGLYVELRFELP